jgi:hypothetical protein
VSIQKLRCNVNGENNQTFQIDQTTIAHLFSPFKTTLPSIAADEMMDGSLRAYLELQNEPGFIIRVYSEAKMQWKW